MHEVTGESVGLAYADQGHTGEETFDEAGDHPRSGEVAQCVEGFRAAATAVGGGSVIRLDGQASGTGADYERVATMLKGMHSVDFRTLLMLGKAAPALKAGSP